uniref:Uncharacterized protein n=1 Tax=Cacopsylla melanoneura TaxID=428564 RepID=A0A8D8QR19_9HEMI
MLGCRLQSVQNHIFLITTQSWNLVISCHLPISSPKVIWLPQVSCHLPISSPKVIWISRKFPVICHIPVSLLSIKRVTFLFKCNDLIKALSNGSAVVKIIHSAHSSRPV